jgi:hypothetical protein
VTFELRETTVHLAVVECFGAFACVLEKKRLGVDFGIHAGDVEGKPRRCAIATTTNDITLTDDEDELTLVIVVEGGEGVDCSGKEILAFHVTGNLAQHELMLELRIALSTELQCSQDCERTNALEPARTNQTKELTLETHTAHQDDGRDDQQVVRRLASGSLP